MSTYGTYTVTLWVGFTDHAGAYRQKGVLLFKTVTTEANARDLARVFKENNIGSSALCEFRPESIEL